MERDAGCDGKVQGVHFASNRNANATVGHRLGFGAEPGALAAEEKGDSRRPFGRKLVLVLYAPGAAASKGVAAVASAAARLAPLY